MKPLNFLSRQTERACYYCLNLKPTGREALEPVCGGWEHCRPEYTIRRRTFKYHAIEFVAAGQGRLLLNGRTHRLAPGSVFSYGPGIPHAIRTNPAAPMLKYFIDFTGKNAGTLLAGTPLALGPVHVSAPYRLQAIFDEIQNYAMEASEHRATICRLLLQLLPPAIAALGTRGRSRPAPTTPTYEKCKRLIDEHFTVLRNLTDIADACGMDRASICRLFRSCGDCSPYNYLTRRKMQHAAARLQRDALLVKQVAVELGFDDPYHFSRIFKRVHGISPQKFIRAAGAG